MQKLILLFLSSYLLISCSSNPSEENHSLNDSSTQAAYTEKEKHDHSQHAATWLTDMEQAMILAKQENKHIFMLFTGSDWCVPCIQFHQDILETEAFTRYAKKYLVLVELDYPTDTSSLTEEQMAHHEVWSDKFHIENYPTIYITDATAKRYAKHIGRLDGDENDYVNYLSKLRTNKPIFDRALTKAETLQGIERAKLLDQALSIDNIFITNRRALINEVFKLAEGDNHLHQKYRVLSNDINLKSDYKKIKADMYSFYEKDLSDDELTAVELATFKQLDDLLKKYSLGESELLLQILSTKASVATRAGMGEASLKEIETIAFGNHYSKNFRQKLANQLPYLYLSYKGIDAAIDALDKTIAIDPNSELGRELSANRQGTIDGMREYTPTEDG
jgi:thioredoxin-related protein